MPALDRSLTATAATGLLERSLSKFASASTFDLVAVRRDDGAILGEVSVSSPQGELQYWLGTPYWGQGYATEIVNGVLALLRGKDAAGPIVACVHRDNRASQRVLEKAGFRFAGLRWRTFPSQRGPVPVLDYRCALPNVPLRVRS
jgi:RimJ/RimL family protein N-acetyltransferase